MRTVFPATGLSGIAVVAVLLSSIFQNTTPAGVSEQPPENLQRGPAVPLRNIVAQDQEFNAGCQLIRAFRGVGLREFVSGQCLEVEDRIEVLIATVPDPEASSLDWIYDSHLSAVQRALEQAGFVIDRYRLPTTSAVGEGGPADRTAWDREPGVFLFRHRDFLVNTAQDGGDPSLVLLYVVGELPTEGVHKEALRSALSERRRLLGSPTAESDTVKILGPVFSGSSLSLRLALNDWLNQEGNQGTSIRVLSGSATSPGNLDILDSKDDGIQFSATVHPTSSFQAALDSLVIPNLGFEPSEVALLTESSTQYGRNVSTAGSSFLTLPVPMSLTALRRESDDLESEGGSLQEVVPTRVSRPEIPLSLQTSPHPREATETRSRLTSPTIDLAMQEIVQTLERHGIKAVGLMFTDIRDKLFLAALIKRYLPDTQLFTFESNLLFLRGDLSHSLKGTLVLSTYPLVLENQWWSGSDRNRIIFPNDGAQGVFNATVSLIGRPDLIQEYRTPLIAETSSAEAGPSGDRADNSMSTYPPVWLTAVGDGSLLPIAIYTAWSGEPEGVHQATTDYLQPGPINESVSTVEDHSEHGWIAELFSLLGVIGLISMGILARTTLNEPRPQRQNSAESGQALTWTVRRGSLKIHTQIYRLLLIVGTTALLLPVLQLGFSSWPRRYLIPVLFLIPAGFVITRLFQLLSAYGPVGWKYANAGDHWTDRSKSSRVLWLAEIAGRFLVTVTGIVFGAMAIWYAIDLAELRATAPLDFLFLRSRALQLTGGISPLLPVVISALGFICWCVLHLRRIKNLETTSSFEMACLASTWDDPEETATGQRSLPTDVREVRDRLFLLLPTMLSFCGFGALLAGLWYLFIRLEPTLEMISLSSVTGGLFWIDKIGTFDTLLCAGILGTLAATSWSAYRLFVVWLAFRRVLGALTDAQFADAFSRLDEGVRPYVRLSFLRPPPQTSAGQITHKLAEELSTLGKAVAGGDPLAKLDGNQPAVQPGNQQNLWNGERQAWTVGEPSSEYLDLQEAIEKRRGDAGSATCEWLKKAEELAAAQVARYLAWVFRHLRRLILFLLISLLLTIALMASYPFQPQSIVEGTLLTVLGITVVTILLVTAGLNRDPTLSRIQGTNPGKLTWNLRFIGNLMAFGVVPLLLILGSRFPTLEAILFVWVGPILRGLGGI